MSDEKHFYILIFSSIRRRVVVAHSWLASSWSLKFNDTHHFVWIFTLFDYPTVTCRKTQHQLNTRFEILQIMKCYFICGMLQLECCKITKINHLLEISYFLNVTFNFMLTKIKKSCLIHRVRNIISCFCEHDLLWIPKKTICMHLHFVTCNKDAKMINLTILRSNGSQTKAKFL